MGTITDKLSYLKNTKTAIKDAIINKGVSVSEDDEFRDFANKISEISSGTKFPPNTFSLCRGFRENAIWTVPFSGKYRFICIGRGGAGADGVYTSGQSSPNTGGGGGGSGGWCSKIVELSEGQEFNIQVTLSSSRIIYNNELYMQATRGQNGGFGTNGIGGAGGAAGTSTGGDDNHNGFPGEDGQATAAGVKASGGNGATTDWQDLPQYLHEGGGLGGYQGDNTNINGQSPFNTGSFTLAFGAGGGGGGAYGVGGIGQSGSPGCVIIEYVLG